MGAGNQRRWLAILASALLAGALFSACGGSRSSNSDQFSGQTKSPLLNFGEEAGEAELEAGEQAVQAFLVARGNGDWSTVCAHLSRSMLEKIEHLAASATGLENKSCPSFLESFTRLTQREREQSEVDGGSLRILGQHGYLIFYGAGKAVYAMRLREEGGEWKVDSLAAEELS